MKVAISQPTYLPWIGYFNIIRQVDIFVFLDNVQFVRRGWEQRNRIKTPSGELWLTVPVYKKGRFEQLINEVIISDQNFWVKHAKTMEINYRRAQYFKDYYEDLVQIMKLNNHKLADLNISIIKFIMDALNIKTQVVLASQLGVKGKRSELLLNICEELGAKEYLSQFGSHVYLLNDIHIFLEKGIDVYFHNYEHPEYSQLYPPFIPYLSVIDLLYNEGPNSYNIIISGSRKPYTPEEVANIVKSAGESQE
ncbi:MAG: WbqC family protein [Aquificaceae bacterium]|nr:WbqC family protein [Aquificaceae bacterium]